jgi:hypothetical protein
MLGEFIMGVGKVFVEYSTIDQAKSARNVL